MLRCLDDALGSNLPHWKAEQRAVVHLYKADMLKGLGDIPAALESRPVFAEREPRAARKAAAEAR